MLKPPGKRRHHPNAMCAASLPLRPCPDWMGLAGPSRRSHWMPPWVPSSLFFVCAPHRCGVEGVPCPCLFRRCHGAGGEWPAAAVPGHHQRAPQPRHRCAPPSRAPSLTPSWSAWSHGSQREVEVWFKIFRHCLNLRGGRGGGKGHALLDPLQLCIHIIYACIYSMLYNIY